MLLNHAEMDCLRLAAWCKDLPQNAPQYLHMGTWDMLCRTGYIRMNRAGSCYRPAVKAVELLRSAGFDYPQDKRRLSAGAALTRRLELSEIILFLYSMGTDVFAESPTQIKPAESLRPDISFLPSFTFRRAKGSNVLGGTRLMGFLYTPQTVFIPYYISTGKEGLYPHDEQATFSTEYLSAGKAPTVIYTGNQDLTDLFQTVDHADKAAFKTKAVTFKTAMDMFSVPVCFVPLSKDGARQLRIMCRPDYRRTLAEALLEKDGYAKSEYLCFDGINKKHGEPFLVGIDMNLKGFDKALEYAGKSTLHIAVLNFQFDAAKAYLKTKNASLYRVPPDIVEEALDMPALPEPDFSPFQTKEGKYINVTDF